MKRYWRAMKTIEIERKVRLEPHQMQKIIQQAALVKEIQIQDSYFDTDDYQYTIQNIWLRQRDGSFELKVGIKKENGAIDRYEEITDEHLILNHLRLDIGVNVQTALSQKKLIPFCSFLTLRKSYRLDEITIDIDDADFGDLRYRVAEIEMVVSDLSKMEEAEQKITHFIKEFDIDTSIPVPAKLSYYLYYKKPDYYQALVQSKVIQPII